MATHLREVQASWDLLHTKCASNDMVVFNGEKDSLKLAHVVAVARYDHSSPSLLQNNHISHAALQELIAG